ncbi:hypothetical protein FGG79_14170 [Bacillus sp. BHET2]|uniref:kinase n=1 Tax=Bacillus sp. BHET2 TaxID=2583818 RepID=UPI00110E88A2|nr:kinase [Bacillus sp. BHET2]TMU85038.1 hypothetical protein FGG79_14170 [Bacillus sp. BHET2]
MKTDFDLMQMINSHQTNSSFILGIDGLSRSGKTTFVMELQDILVKESQDFHIFHIDDHIVERARRYNTGYEEWYEYFQLQWDTAWLTENFFRDLKNSNQITLPFYDSQTDTHQSKFIRLPKKGVIIVEGVFLQREKWRAFFDKVVYLDCTREQRFMRESQATQQNPAKFENRYWKAEEYYLNVYNPTESADVVIKT